MISNVTLTVLGSSCVEATASIEQGLDLLIQRLISNAAALGVTVSPAQIQAVVSGCAPVAGRRLDVVSDSGTNVETTASDRRRLQTDIVVDLSLQVVIDSLSNSDIAVREANAPCLPVCSRCWCVCSVVCMIGTGTVMHLR